MLCPWFIERLILPLWRNPDSSIWEIIACEIQNPGNSCLCNPESWALQSGLQLKEYRIPVIIGIRNPSSIDKETGFQELESGIHCVESRIQNCRGVQPPSQALRFLHRGDRETRASDTRVSGDEEQRIKGRFAVCFLPAFLCEHRERDVWVRGSLGSIS